MEIGEMIIERLKMKLGVTIYSESWDMVEDVTMRSVRGMIHILVERSIHNSVTYVNR